MNRLVNKDLAAITEKPQTTRKRISGIRTEGENQIIFLDTPGHFQPGNFLEEIMQAQISRAISDSDIILLMISTDNPLFPDEIADTGDVPVIMVINKIDKTDDATLLTIKSEIEKSLFEEIIPISALKGDNIDELISSIIEYLPEHPPFYPPEYLSDRNERFFIEEIIRENLFKMYRQEIPYSTAVKVLDMNDDKIFVNIFVEKESQKGIIIGEKGKKLKEVATQSRKKIEEFLDRHIYLDIWVKVKKKWRKNKAALHELGYYE